MCINFFWIPDPSTLSEFKLIMAMNRDEYFNRPTKPAEWKGNMFGGWDNEEGKEGGTWFACNREGRVAFLTNIYTGGISKNGRGRGFLVVDFLSGDLTAEEYMERLAADETFYNPFNLVLLEPEGVDGYSGWQYTRGLDGHTESCQPRRIKFGLHGVSNHPINQPFKKTLLGQEVLSDIVSSVETKEQVFEHLEKLLKNSTPNWPDDQISKQSQHSGSGPLKNIGQFLSSIFVRISGYGTRTHSILLVDKHWRIHFKEITMDNEHWKTTLEEFCIER